MVQKQIYICDRCGKQYEELTDWGDKNPDNIMCYHKPNGDHGILLNIPQKYDLCHDCEKEFLEWFYRQPIIEDNNGEDSENPGDNPEIPGGGENPETPNNPNENDNQEGEQDSGNENVGGNIE